MGNQHSVMLLTRAGCGLCDGRRTSWPSWRRSSASTLATTDVDAAAAAGDPALRTEYGDRLPVVLLDGREHSYWEVDEARLRTDLAAG